jgi:hypothetical protein
MHRKEQQPADPFGDELNALQWSPASAVCATAEACWGLCTGGKELKALAETMSMTARVVIKSSTATPDALAARAAPAPANDEIPPPLFP